MENEEKILALLENIQSDLCEMRADVANLKYDQLKIQNRIEKLDTELREAFANLAKGS